MPGQWCSWICLSSHPPLQPSGGAPGILGRTEPPVWSTHSQGTWGSSAAAGSRAEGRKGGWQTGWASRLFRRCPSLIPFTPHRGLREVRAPPVVPVPVLKEREVAVTDTLLRKILGHPEKPREQLPGQPVRPLARIPQAGTGCPGEEGGGNMGWAWRNQTPGAVASREQVEGLQGVLTWDPEAGHGPGGRGRRRAPVGGGPVSR